MRVVVGLSGGVDSSVAAHLLVEEGHEVIGLFMRNWNDESVTINNECPWIDDANDAMLVANHLGIPFQVMDLSVEYKERIVDYMFDEYAAGRTPNPDVLCNREVKFDLFLDAALKLGADAVATGHYCRRATDDQGIHHLKRNAEVVGHEHGVVGVVDPGTFVVDGHTFVVPIAHEQSNDLVPLFQQQVGSDA